MSGPTEHHPRDAPDIAHQSESALDLRTAYLPAEATVRTIGLIYVLMGVAFLVALSFNLYHNVHASLSEQQRPDADLTFRNIVIGVLVLVTVGVMVLGTTMFIALGRWLRKFSTWSRWTIIGLNLVFVLSMGMSLFESLRLQQGPRILPLLMILGWAGLWVSMAFFLLRPATGVVFSKHYRIAVSETAEVQPTLGNHDKILLGVFFLDIVLTIATALTA